MFPSRALSNWRYIGRSTTDSQLAFTRLAHIIPTCAQKGVPFFFPVRSMSSLKNRNECVGCGCKLQSLSEDVSGYIPEGVFNAFNSGWKRDYVIPSGVESTTIPDGVEVVRAPAAGCYIKTTKPYCQRCFVTQQYRRDPFLNHSSLNRVCWVPFTVDSLFSLIGVNSIIINIMDITDFESSVIPEVIDVASRRNIPLIHVINKMDCLPIESREWKHVVEWAVQLSRPLRSYMGIDGRTNIVPVSSVSEENFETLESRMGAYLAGGVRKDIHVVGRANGGKSTFVNRFLHFIKHKHVGTIHYKRAVGGITRSPFPGTTLKPIEFALGNNVRLIDTPGISTFSGISEYYTCPEDFRDMLSGAKYQPVSHSIKGGKTLFIGGMVRLEVAMGQSAIFTCFVPPRMTMHICDTPAADDVLNRKIGTFLYPPHVTETSKSNTAHPITNLEWIRHRVAVYCGPSKIHDDIVVSGVGWIGVSGHGHKEIDVLVPPGVKVFRRPAMIPKYLQQTGVTKFSFRQRGRTLSVNKRKKAIVQALRVEARVKQVTSSSTKLEDRKQKNPHQCSEDGDMMPLSIDAVHYSRI